MAVSDAAHQITDLTAALIERVVADGTATTGSWPIARRLYHICPGRPPCTSTIALTFIIT